MRVIVRYVAGRPEWSDNVPSYARLAGFGGRPIEEQPAKQRGEPTSDQARHHKARRDAERAG